MRRDFFDLFCHFVDENNLNLRKMRATIKARYEKQESGQSGMKLADYLKTT